MKMSYIVFELLKKIAEENIRKILVKKMTILMERAPNKETIPEPLRDLYAGYAGKENLQELADILEQDNRLVLALNYLVQHERAYPAWAATIREVWEQSGKQVLQEAISVKDGEERQTTIGDLPELALSNILFFLPARDVGSFCAVSKTWNRIADDELHWQDRIHKELTTTPVLQGGQSYKEYYTSIYNGTRYERLLEANYGCYQRKGAYGTYLRQRMISPAFNQEALKVYLKVACLHGAEIWVADLLRQGTCIKNMESIDARYLLSGAIEGANHEEGGNPAVLRVLIDAGIDFNADSGHSEPSALHVAALSEHYRSFLQLMLQKSTSITIIPVLHKAALMGDYTSIGKLLAAGADVNEPDRCGCTALWWALINEQEKSVEILLANRASTSNIARWPNNSFYGIEDSHYNSALMIALMRKNYNCLRLLLKAGANIDETITGCFKPTTVSLLHVAAKHDFVEGLELLVTNGLKVNNRRYQYSALHVAAKHGSLASLEWLLKYGAAVNQQAEWVELDEDFKHDRFCEYTPLFLAAEHGHVECMSRLLNRGGIIIASKRRDINKARFSQVVEYDEVSSVPVLNAFIGTYNDKLDVNHFLEGLQLLLKNGANPNEVDNSYGRKYSALAVLFDRWANKMAEGALATCVELLLEFHADPSQGFALHKVIEINNLHIVKLLVESGKIDILQRSEPEGNTPLMLAAKNNFEMFKYLFEHGGSLQEGNKSGETAIDYAKKAKQQKIIDFIQQHALDIPKAQLEQMIESAPKLQVSQMSMFKPNVVHNKLIAAITPIIEKNHSLFKNFMDAIQEKAYGKALRRACTIKPSASNAQDAFEVIKILISYKDQLAFDINEKGAGKTAHDYSVLKGNQELCEFLAQHGAFTSTNAAVAHM